jgi:hypothetical protein
MVAAFLLVGNGPLRAQTDYSMRKASSRLTIGAGAYLGISVPTGTLPDSIEPAPGFSGSIGLNASYPLNSTIGTFVNVGYDSRGVGKKVNKALDAVSYRAGYLFFEPGISLSAFRLSVNIGLPLSLSQPDPTGMTTESVTASKDLLSTLIEPRVGAHLILMENKEWWLGLQIDAGYAVNTFYKDVPDGFEGIEKANMITGHLGLSWQFAIPGT